MAIVQDFGAEAANRLNRRVCRALGEAEMRRLIKAVGIAALRSGKLPEVEGSVAVVVSGGNVGLTVLHDILESRVPGASR